MHDTFYVEPGLVLGVGVGLALGGGAGELRDELELRVLGHRVDLRESPQVLAHRLDVVHAEGRGLGRQVAAQQPLAHPQA